MSTNLQQPCGHHQPNAAYICTKRAGHIGMHGEHRVEGGGFASTWFDDEHPLSTKQTAARGEAVLQNATLPERMRAAAEVLVEASRRYDSERGSVVTNFAATSWDAANLTLVADRWEAADAAEAEKDRLARELADAFRLRADDGATALAIARELVADGWTKGEKAP